jgi:hypothetical protein
MISRGCATAGAGVASSAPHSDDERSGYHDDHDGDGGAAVVSAPSDLP